ILFMGDMTEVEKVKIAATENKYWYVRPLINAALKAEVFMNLNEDRPYTYERIYAMLREGKDWVTTKLVDYAEKNPIK
ncbi:hypothetical protein KA005_65380, partial [bacterium]|nr:hypothetical protein [bacterium]